MVRRCNRVTAPVYIGLVFHQTIAKQSQWCACKVANISLLNLTEGFNKYYLAHERCQKSPSKSPPMMSKNRHRSNKSRKLRLSTVHPDPWAKLDMNIIPPQNAKITSISHIGIQISSDEGSFSPDLHHYSSLGPGSGCAKVSIKCTKQSK